MRTIARLAAAALALSLLPEPASLAAHHAKKKAPARRAELPRVESVFRATEAPLPKSTRIFLFAGSSLAASFANEVVEQRRLWLKAGFREDEIACYYIVPFQEDLIADSKRFLAIAPELAKCYAASTKLLRAHLAAIAREKPPFLYLYVTSHGEKPVSYILEEARPSDEDYWALQREKRYPVFEQYQILVEGMTDGSASASEVLGALRAGIDPGDLYLTPRSLKAMLEQGFADVPKVVVLQGCFTGGFIEEPSAERSADLLSSLPKLTALTASRHDRSSFGCENGNHTTYYGGAYLETLARFASADLRRIDWAGLHKALLARVTEIEKRKKADPPSLPQYFSNWHGTPGN